MAKQNKSLQLVNGNAPVVKIALFSQTIRKTFWDFGIPMKMVEVKIEKDNLCFIFQPVEPVRMHIIKSFEDDLRFSLAHEKIEIIAPMPNTKAIGIAVYMNVSRDIYGIPEPEGIPSPWMSGDDDLYEDALRAVIEAGKASTAYLQRKLRVGYARAAQLIDMLEERGIVGPGDGSAPRELLIDPDDEY